MSRCGAKRWNGRAWITSEYQDALFVPDGNASGPFFLLRPLASLAILITLFAFQQVRSAASRLVRLENPNPLRRWRVYKRNRGMSPWRDHVDWVGGYPYETAKPEQIFDFYRKHGFSLEFLQTGGLGCNEFVFAYPQHEIAAVTEHLETPVLRAETAGHR